MKAQYKGYDLEVVRERCQGGWDMTYHYIYRASDGFECVCDFTEDETPVREQMKWLKERVDEEVQRPDPWDEMSIYGEEA